MTTYKIPWAKPVFFGKESQYLADAFESSWISGGPYVDRFEKEFSAYNRSPYGITVSNGTAALHLALLAYGIGAGDEVIVPGFSFAAAVNMIKNLGAVPVFADIEPDTWCIDPLQLESKITSKTKAVIVVHNYGNVSEMDQIVQITRSRKLVLIEDAAESIFSRYQQKFAGTFGDAGCFSFQATKTITMGEGGFVAVDKSDICSKMRIIRDHGMSPEKRYWHDVAGFNFRLTNLQAAIGCAQLEKADKVINSKKKIFQLYLKYLSGNEAVRFQRIKEKVDPVIWTVAIQLDPDGFKLNRDEIMRSLQERGIETRPGFYSFSKMPFYNAPPMPVSELVSSKVISLPSFCSISEEEISFICKCINGLKK